MPLPADTRVNIPGDLDTAAWDKVRADIRRRAFFMAGVERAEVLQAFRDTARAVSEGKLSPVEARKRLRAALARLNYRPAEGEEGTIKDLGTIKRMNVAIETNVEMVHGWANHTRQLGDTAYPAQELYRAEQRNAPRNWQARWMEAARQVGGKGVAKDGSMVALLTSPIWKALSRFGNPYPPYDFNSGMDVKPVGFKRAQELGLITPESVEDIKRARDEALEGGMNAGVEARPGVRDADLRAQLAKELDGVAEFDGEVLRMI